MNEFPDYPSPEEVFGSRKKPSDENTLRINAARDVIREYVNGLLVTFQKAGEGDEPEDMRGVFDGEISNLLLENLLFKGQESGDARQEVSGEVTEEVPRSEYEVAVEVLYQWEILKWRPT